MELDTLCFLPVSYPIHCLLYLKNWIWIKTSWKEGAVKMIVCMRNKEKINVPDLLHWRANNWEMYQQQSYKGERLSFYTNELKGFRVTFGIDVLYEGSHLKSALEAWEGI